MKKDLIYFEDSKHFYQITSFTSNTTFEAVRINHTEKVQAEYVLFKLGERKCRHFIVLNTNPEPIIATQDVNVHKQIARVQSFHLRTKRGRYNLYGINNLKFKDKKVNITYFLIQNNVDRDEVQHEQSSYSIPL